MNSLIIDNNIFIRLFKIYFYIYNKYNFWHLIFNIIYF